MDDLPTVLFRCVDDAGRSQVAAGWPPAAEDCVHVLPAGSELAGRVTPLP